MKTLTKQIGAAAISLSVMAIIPAAGGPLETTLDEPPSIGERLVLSQTNTLLPIIAPTLPERVVKTIPVMVTAYSSTESQTDSTPFITASGTWVREGIVAANFVPIGTRIKLPELYGEKVFIVEDRMHPRKKYQVDIWFPSYIEAKNFGAKLVDVEILGS
ncbi:MAG: 3D domain-containing protein [Patescibacteria group bacterium]|nr:3D domain-containing protein [Patescibacteria group bacterium]